MYNDKKRKRVKETVRLFCVTKKKKSGVSYSGIMMIR